MKLQPPSAKSTKLKLSRYAKLITRFGVGSEEEQAFLMSNQDDRAFLQLARWAVRMKSLVGRREKT